MILPFVSDTSADPAPRKWDAEIDTARRQDTWLAFESGIHQNPALRARVARALDRDPSTRNHGTRRPGQAHPHTSVCEFPAAR